MPPYLTLPWADPRFHQVSVTKRNPKEDQETGCLFWFTWRKRDVAGSVLAKKGAQLSRQVDGHRLFRDPDVEEPSPRYLPTLHHRTTHSSRRVHDRREHGGQSQTINLFESIISFRSK